MNRKFVIGCALALALKCGLHAQEQLELQVSHIFSARFQGNDPGAVGITQTACSYSRRVSLESGNSLNYRATVEWYSFDFNKPPAGPGNKEWLNDAAGLRLGAVYRFSPADNWEAGLGAGLKLHGEPEADFQDTVEPGTLLYGARPFGDKLKLGIGVALAKPIEQGWRGTPLPVIEYEINDKLLLATRESGLMLRHTLSAQDQLIWSLSFNQIRIRLDDDAPVPDGVVEYKQLPLTVRWQHGGRSGWVFNTEIGTVLRQKMTLEDDQGHELEGMKTRPAILFGLRASYRF